MEMIAAVNDDWGIGMNGKLLYHIHDDMLFFKEKTMNKIIVMGRKTWKNIGKRPLPGRINIILSSSMPSSANQDIIITDNPDFIFKKDSKQNPVMIIGGQSVYQLFKPYCKTAWITKINDNADADAFFPNLDKDNDWILMSASKPKTDPGTRLSFRFCMYQKI